MAFQPVLRLLQPVRRQGEQMAPAIDTPDDQFRFLQDPRACLEIVG